MTKSDTVLASNFIAAIIDADIKANKNNGNNAVYPIKTKFIFSSWHFR